MPALRLAGLTCALALLAACGPAPPPEPEPAAPKVYDVRGTFVASQFEGKVMVVDHQEIPGFMAEMRMDFTLENPEEIRELEQGDEIRFRLHVTDEKMWADRVEKVLVLD